MIITTIVKQSEISTDASNNNYNIDNSTTPVSTDESPSNIATKLPG